MTRTLLDPKALLTQREVANRLGVTERTIFTWRREGKFPPPRRLGTRSLRWEEHQIDEWLESK